MLVLVSTQSLKCSHRKRKYVFGWSQGFLLRFHYRSTEGRSRIKVWLIGIRVEGVVLAKTVCFASSSSPQEIITPPRDPDRKLRPNTQNKPRQGILAGFLRSQQAEAGFEKCVRNLVSSLQSKQQQKLAPCSICRHYLSVQM